MEKTMVIEPVKRNDAKTEESQQELHNENQERGYMVFVADRENEGIAAEMEIKEGKDRQEQLLKRKGAVERIRCGPEKDKTKNQARNVQQTKEVQEDLNRYR